MKTTHSIIVGVAIAALIILAVVIYEGTKVRIWIVPANETSSGKLFADPNLKKLLDMRKHKLIVFNADTVGCFPVYVSDKNLIITTDAESKTIKAGIYFIFVNYDTPVTDKPADREIIYQKRDYASKIKFRRADLFWDSE